MSQSPPTSGRAAPLAVTKSDDGGRPLATEAFVRLLDKLHFIRRAGHVAADKYSGAKQGANYSLCSREKS